MITRLFFTAILFCFFATVQSQTFTPDMDVDVDVTVTDNSQGDSHVIYYNIAWLDSLGVEHVDFPHAETMDYWAVKSMLETYQKANPEIEYFIKTRFKKVKKN